MKEWLGVCAEMLEPKLKSFLQCRPKQFDANKLAATCKPFDDARFGCATRLGVDVPLYRAVKFAEPVDQVRVVQLSYLDVFDFTFMSPEENDAWREGLSL